MSIIMQYIDRFHDMLDRYAGKCGVAAECKTHAGGDAGVRRGRGAGGERTGDPREILGAQEEPRPRNRK